MIGKRGRETGRCVKPPIWGDGGWNTGASGIRGLIVDYAKDCFVLLRRPRNDGGCRRVF